MCFRFFSLFKNRKGYDLFESRQGPTTGPGTQRALNKSPGRTSRLDGPHSSSSFKVPRLENTQIWGSRALLMGRSSEKLPGGGSKAGEEPEGWQGGRAWEGHASLPTCHASAFQRARLEAEAGGEPGFLGSRSQEVPRSQPAVGGRQGGEAGGSALLQPGLFASLEIPGTTGALGEWVSAHRVSRGGTAVGSGPD